MAVTLHVDGSAFELDASHGPVDDVISQIDRFIANGDRFAWFNLASGKNLHVRLTHEFRYSLSWDVDRPKPSEVP